MSLISKGAVDEDLIAIKKQGKNHPELAPLVAPQHATSPQHMIFCDDVLLRIFEFMFLNHRVVMSSFAMVSRGWYQCITSERSNLLWSRLAKQRWLALNEHMTIKNWFALFKRRVTKLKQNVQLSKSTIENCDFEYECPIAFDELKETDKPNERYCNVCKHNVYMVYNQLQVDWHTENNHCIGYVPNEHFDKGTLRIIGTSGSTGISCLVRRLEGNVFIGDSSKQLQTKFSYKSIQSELDDEEYMARADENAETILKAKYLASAAKMVVSVQNNSMENESKNVSIKVFNIDDTKMAEDTFEALMASEERYCISMLLFDLTNEESFNKIENYIMSNVESLNNHVLLVGTKCDQQLPQYQALKQRATALIEKSEHNIKQYIECSALTGEGIEQIKKFVSDKIHRDSLRRTKKGKRKAPTIAY